MNFLLFERMKNTNGKCVQSAIYITYFVTLMLYAMAFTSNGFIIYFLLSLSILLSLLMNSNSSVSKDTLHSSHTMFTILQHNKHNHTLTGTTFFLFYIVLCCFLRHKLGRKDKVNCCSDKNNRKSILILCIL